jgi:hypothetical protein
MELSEEAKEYADKLFPCEGATCGSWAACDACCERTCFEAGYNFGVKAAATNADGIENK